MSFVSNGLFALLALTAPQADGPDLVGDVPYARKETRAATRDFMRAQLQPEKARFGDWHLLTPFDFKAFNEGQLALELPPEEELANMAAGGAGPDLTKTYEGKNGVEASWRPLGRIDNTRVDLHVFEEEELSNWALCYLYSTIEASEATSMDVTFGTDDGVRFWLNGELLVDHDVARGMTPTDEELTLELEAGVNHVLVKVSEGGGGWEFQMNSRKPLPARSAAQLKYYLDRDFPLAADREFYDVYTINVPDDVVLEVGGLDTYADGRPVVCTRRGDVYVVDGAYEVPPLDATYTRFASGLHEPLGLAVRNEGGQEIVYAAQRGELTRLVDEDGDGRADLYDAFSDDWGLSGNYHEFAFGPKFDSAGNAWVTLNVGFCGSLGKSIAPWRGWALQVTPGRELVPVCDGLRSPNGIGVYSDGTVFYLDNQGDYVATNRLSELAPGSWHGHPASLRWRDDLEGPDARPARKAASVWFPYKKLGQSTADIALDETGGVFGPFTGQFFVGDQLAATVNRVFLEKVEGHYQGACFAFLEGLDCGVNRVDFAPDGSMFLGQTDRGWASVGQRSYGLQRVVFRGKTPFEILAMRALENGFELEFTLPLDAATATDPGSYSLQSYTYAYHSKYGAPEEDHAELAITDVEVVNERVVRLTVDPLRAGYVHELAARGVRSAAREERGSEPLLHPVAYYTLERIPGQDARALPTERELSKKVLFLTHSAGFQHSVVKRPEEGPAWAEAKLEAAVASAGMELISTQDPLDINADRLAEVDAVVFYTTGELPISEAGRTALMDWLRKGGAFVGVHSATDTFYEYAPYQAMIGGAFDGHPWHEEVTVTVEDAAHPATAHLGDSFRITDEIYQFRNFQRYPLHVLLALDGSSVEVAKGKREDGDYALAWCRPWGEGRMFYSALGHREEVWDDERFLRHVVGGLRWAMGDEDVSPPPPEGARLLSADAANWAHRDGSESKWAFADGVMEVVPKTGNLITRDAFGDGLWHIEFRVPPSPPEATGQARGNSGVYFQGRYEVQVLDSYGIEQEMGDCGSIYGIKIADVNACRPQGEWQSYDVRFRAPRFDADGNKTESARMSVWHNGIPIHVDVEVPRTTTAAMSSDEMTAAPLLLQDHGHPVRYRNVWFLPQ